jgi:thiaminase/transcriptional activator TenA
MLHEELWESNRDLAESCLLHPFVRGLDDGTLPRVVFRRYVAQDAFFLDAFARAYALALARSHGLDTIESFHGLIGGVREELKLHRAYAAELQIDLTQVKPAPACRAYTDFLLATAWRGSSSETLAAMTPCMRLYAFLGRELARTAVRESAELQERPYSRWIATYSDPAFHRLADQLEQLLDRLVGNTMEISAVYRYAMQCELDFFSDAFRGPLLSRKRR